MRVALVILFLSLAGPGWTETAQVGFDVRLFGIRLGELAIERRIEGAAYDATGRFATTGAIGLLARVFFDMTAQGRITEGRPWPAAYAEDLDTGFRQSTARVAFEPGDTRLDPLTGLLAGLGDRPAEPGCALDYEIFDGTRSHRLTIAPGTWQDDALTCAGRYVRTAGYTPRELAGHKGYDFTVTYLRRGDRLIASRARADTKYGRISIRRRPQAGPDEPLAR